MGREENKMENIVFFGSGKIAKKIYPKYKGAVVAVIDNNIEKWGLEFEKGIPIISLEEYIDNYAEAFPIYIATAYANEIIEQLKQCGIFNYKIPVELFEDPLVPTDPEIAHGNWNHYLKNLCDRPGNEILEVGSRVVTGAYFRKDFEQANYTGFDLYAGKNVDVVGDAHRLSCYFDNKFDLIFSSACFEHFVMPWQVSLEMIKCLKVGGYIFVETHYSYSSHERPWHFFQFSENALNALFPEKFGMKCIKKGCSNLLEGAFSDKATPYLRGRLVRGMYCHSEILLQKVVDVPDEDLDWSKIRTVDVVGSTKYPRREDVAR